jgi:hypothetical protein
MNTRFRLCAVVTVALAGLTFNTSALAALIASDNASNAPYSSSWPNGSNGGLGWGGGWILSAAGGSFGGHFVSSSSGNGSGTSGNIDTAGKSWGMYANTTNITDAIRPFSGALSVGQSFALDMDNGFIDSGGTPSPTVGFGLRNSSNLNRLEFYFKGGDPSYTYSDSTGTHSSGIGFTANGLHAEVTLTGIDTYQLKVTPSGGATSTFSGTLADGAGSGIDRVRLFNANAGNGGSNNAFFNSIAVTPEPASLGLLAAASLMMLGRRR